MLATSYKTEVALLHILNKFTNKTLKEVTNIDNWILIHEEISKSNSSQEFSPMIWYVGHSWTWHACPHVLNKVQMYILLLTLKIIDKIKHVVSFLTKVNCFIGHFTKTRCFHMLNKTHMYIYNSQIYKIWILHPNKTYAYSPSPCVYFGKIPRLTPCVCLH